MKLDEFTAKTQAVLSAIYLLFTFTIILIYELGLAKLTTQSQEKTFDSMVNWMTGGALIVLYFWLQRAKGTTNDPVTTTIRTETPPPPAPQTTTVTMKPNPEPPNDPSTLETIVLSDRDADAQRLRDAQRSGSADVQPESARGV